MKQTERTLEDIEKEILETKEELNNVHGTETEVYARIVGYYRAVKHWNKGKRDEFDHRKMFVFNDDSSEAEERITEDNTKSEINTLNAKNELFTESSTESSIEYFELFTRKTCPNCPPVKEFVEKLNIQGNKFDVDSHEGFTEATKKGVFASPTVIFYDSNNNEISRFHSVEKLEEYFDEIRIIA